MSEKKKAKELSVLATYKAVFGSVKGKEVLHDLIEKCGMFSISYVPNDSHGTAFNEGTRSMLLNIISKLELHPNEVRDLYSANKEYVNEGEYDDE